MTSFPEPPPTRPRRWCAAAVGALLLFSALAGCAGGGHDTADARPTVHPATHTPTPSPTKPPPAPSPTVTTRDPTLPPTEPLRVAKGMTKPGTRLRFGQKAIVPFRAYDSFEKTYTEGVIGIVVHQVEHTAGSRMTGNFDAKSEAVLKTHTAYFSKITITNESGTDMTSVTSPNFEPLVSGGGQPDLQLIGGDVPGCDDDPSPDSFDRKGATWTTCQVGASSAYRPITEMRYKEPPYGKEIQVFSDDPAPMFNQYYDLGALTWY